MEKRQIVVIGGGEAFDTRGEYLSYLRTCVYDPYEMRPDGWKKNLSATLGDRYEVIALQMPCSSNAKYEEWEIWFERVIPFLRDEVSLIGHSLGANFLVKYLAEHSLPVPVSCLHLVSGCFGYVGGFSLPESFVISGTQIRKILIYHSKDDPIVPFSDAEKYREALPGSELVPFSDRGHFLTENFPEIVDRIRD